MPDITLEQALENRKLRPALTAWAKREHRLDALGFLFDMMDHKPFQYIYELYISTTGKREINLQGSVTRPLHALALQGADGFKEMGPALAAALTATYSYFRPNFGHGDHSFLLSKEYATFKSGGVQLAPAVSGVLTKLKLTGAKATSMQGLLQVYVNARTIGDATEAYLAMQKIVAKAKLDVALKDSGGKTIAEMEAEVLSIKNAALAAKLVPAIRTDLAAAKTYFDDSLAKLKRVGKPGSRDAVTNTFQGGRRRMQKLDESYVKAVKIDKNFATKNPALAIQKKKLDEQYGEFRKLLGVS